MLRNIHNYILSIFLINKNRQGETGNEQGN